MPALDEWTGRLPRLGVEGLLRRLGEQRELGCFSRHHRDCGRPARRGFGAAADGRRVDNVVPHRIRVALEHRSSTDLEPILSGQAPEIELWTELIEPMAQTVIRRAHDDEMSTNANHLHAVLEGGRRKEDVLERPGIKYEIELSVKLRIYSRVEIVKVGCSFIVGNVERPHLLGSQIREERLSETPIAMHEIGALGLRQAVTERLQDPAERVLTNEKLLAAQGRSTGERYPVACLRFQQKAEVVFGKSHARLAPVPARLVR